MVRFAICTAGYFIVGVLVLLWIEFFFRPAQLLDAPSWRDRLVVAALWPLVVSILITEG